MTAPTAPTDLALSGTAQGAPGAATLVLAVPGRMVPWTVSQVSVECDTASPGATCVLRKNGNAVTPLVPQLDAAGGDPPVHLWPGDNLTVEWGGLNPGDFGKALMIYVAETYG